MNIQNDIYNASNRTNSFQTNPSQKPLNIIIVGAGIGGLSAAILLRQQGHHITVLEQSRFANELGAAVHLAPNANGLLRRMGLFAEEGGANPTLAMTQFLPDGKVMFSVDLTKMSKMWQHEWLLAHRVKLHEALKKLATGEEGKGRPVELRTSSKVKSVDTKGTVALESGEELQAEIVVGADGIHSRTRKVLPGGADMKTFGSGKSAFRFLMPRERALANPETKKFAEREGHLAMFMGRDRRVVIYPTMNNTLLNFVCIHPTEESEVKADGNDWQQQAHLGKMLEIYKDFEPALVMLLSMADEETLKVWELLDMEQLPTWTDGQLVCIGDAAHPFTPHQGQGAGQAIEDAASLAVMFPLGVPISEIPERLQLYQKCRYERASRIQEYSRIVGKDLGSGPPLDANEYTGYNFGHDEWDYSSQQLRKYLWAKRPNAYWRMPTSFGPMPGPRQDVLGQRRSGKEARYSTASITFRTSRTVLQNLFPTEAFKFSSPATSVLATFSISTLSSLEWLGGKGYTHLGLYIHGVEYKNAAGDITRGTYLPILFENLADPIVSGREELGMPKLYCEIDVKQTANDWGLTAGWMGAKFCDISISGLDVSQAHETLTPRSSGLLWYKYVPTSGVVNGKESRGSDAEYGVLLPSAEEAKVEKEVGKTLIGKGGIKFNKLDWNSLPTLHHVIERLEEIPLYGIVEAKLVEGRGVSDVAAAIRL
ncbi:FAD/NAD(P)-binding domain-containing protein [Amniculicola lignicola CBS 123094]|uniref:FAD/NAD(P)-binding domain-containing protein n=1 Tax=Amniculicola lignicola CBS 123094 TaxID=1392246 RepID=A0A6A5WP36_9PLEO|nr:FAD/NAD(P)-binding domain-containing protein [Amniculicola lignicola CBS 123094]